jgi:hypothetical protein
MKCHWANVCVLPKQEISTEGATKAKAQTRERVVYLRGAMK